MVTRRAAKKDADQKQKETEREEEANANETSHPPSINTSGTRKKSVGECSTTLGSRSTKKKKRRKRGRRSRSGKKRNNDSMQEDGTENYDTSIGTSKSEPGLLDGLDQCDNEDETSDTVVLVFEESARERLQIPEASHVTAAACSSSAVDDFRKQQDENKKTRAAYPSGNMATGEPAQADRTKLISQNSQENEDEKNTDKTSSDLKATEGPYDENKKSDAPMDTSATLLCDGLKVDDHLPVKESKKNSSSADEGISIDQTKSPQDKPIISPDAAAEKAPHKFTVGKSGNSELKFQSDSQEPNGRNEKLLEQSTSVSKNDKNHENNEDKELINQKLKTPPSVSLKNPTSSPGKKGKEANARQKEKTSSPAKASIDKNHENNEDEEPINQQLKSPLSVSPKKPTSSPSKKGKKAITVQKGKTSLSTKASFDKNHEKNEDEEPINQELKFPPSVSPKKPTSSPSKKGKKAIAVQKGKTSLSTKAPKNLIKKTNQNKKSSKSPSSTSMKVPPPSSDVKQMKSNAGLKKSTSSTQKAPKTLPKKTNQIRSTLTDMSGAKSNQKKNKNTHPNAKIADTKKSKNTALPTNNSKPRILLSNVNQISSTAHEEGGEVQKETKTNSDEETVDEDSSNGDNTATIVGHEHNAKQPRGKPESLLGKNIGRMDDDIDDDEDSERTHDTLPLPGFKPVQYDLYKEKIRIFGHYLKNIIYELQSRKNFYFEGFKMSMTTLRTPEKFVETWKKFGSSASGVNNRNDLLSFGAFLEHWLGKCKEYENIKTAVEMPTYTTRRRWNEGLTDEEIESELRYQLLSRNLDFSAEQISSLVMNGCYKKSSDDSADHSEPSKSFQHPIYNFGILPDLHRKWLMDHHHIHLRFDEDRKIIESSGLEEVCKWDWSDYSFRLNANKYDEVDCDAFLSLNDHKRIHNTSDSYYDGFPMLQDITNEQIIKYAEDKVPCKILNASIEKIFLKDKWLTSETVNFYIYWSMRGMPLCNDYVFVAPLNDYIRDMAHSFYKEDFSVEDSMKLTMAIWRMIHPFSYDHWMSNKESFDKYSDEDMKKWKFRALKSEIVSIPIYDNNHYVTFYILNGHLGDSHWIITKQQPDLSSEPTVVCLDPYYAPKVRKEQEIHVGQGHKNIFQWWTSIASSIEDWLDNEDCTTTSTFNQDSHPPWDTAKFWRQEIRTTTGNFSFDEETLHYTHEDDCFPGLLKKITVLGSDELPQQQNTIDCGIYCGINTCAVFQYYKFGPTY